MSTRTAGAPRPLESPLPPHGVRGGAAALGLAALGVVFGDIGTSPLYTLHECMAAEHGAPPTPANILGVLSLIFWSLTMVVSVKYLTFVMRADNQGEGGILALLALIPDRLRTTKSGRVGWVAILVIIGASLLYGDGIITPAISVLSAFEGLEVVRPMLKPAVVPLTCVVLFGLFALQQRGTKAIGRLFGPVMVAWFLTIGVLGAFHLLQNPSVLAALSPLHAVRFFAAHGVRGVLVLGAVVLAVTGGEALYADMGHFGARPIRLAWFVLVMPALVLNYFGQGALMLSNPAARASPFFAMVPPGAWSLALVVLSALATVIASQALISGAFSLTHQAVQLGFFPRVRIQHTSQDAEGQIYVPVVNWLLAGACIALVLVFQSSSRLAAAYGIAVTGTMALTSVVYFEVTRATWRWPLWKSAALLALFFTFDIPFLVANLFKFTDGGYVPVLAGAVVFIVMLTWKTGRRLYQEHVAALCPPLDQFLAELNAKLATRISGSAVFLSGPTSGTPLVLVHHVQRIRALPDTIVLVSVEVTHLPREEAANIALESLGNGFYRVTVRRGFMDVPDVPEALAIAVEQFKLPVDLSQTTYYVGRGTFLATNDGRMGRVAERLFAFLARNADSAPAHFRIPPNQVVEIGLQIDL
ncbi:MAG: KUP/HAK/KT family potassium transporter [Polyangiaceae bacterium]